MENIEISDIVAGAYEAAMDENLWQSWQTRLAEYLGGVGSTFFVLSGAEQQIENLVACWGRTHDAMPDYLDGWWEFDPQMKQACSLAQSDIYLDTDHVDLGNRQTAEYMAWQRDCGFDHHMTAITLLGSGDARAGISIHRSTSAGHTPLHEQKKLAAMFPEISQALKLNYQYGELLQTAYWDGIANVKSESAAMLIDDRNRVIRITRLAEEIVARNDGLRIHNRALTASLHDEGEKLCAIIRRAITMALPSSGAMRISRPSGRRALVITCYPLPRSSRLLAPCSAAALICIHDPSADRISGRRICQEAFGLSARETDVAMELMKGHSIETAAASLAIAMPTARTHLQRLFTKIGCNRQSDLIRILHQIQ